MYNLLNKQYADLPKKNFYACVLILEKVEQDFNNIQIFDESSEDNWPIILRFLGRLIQSFAEINFKGKVLHGNIQPEKIKIKVSQYLNPSEVDVEPVIIDFDLSLENPKEKDISDIQLRYAPLYRPSEMSQATIGQSHDKTQNWYSNWQNYKYSGEFIEDSYALGVTILSILEIQYKNVDRNSDEYDKLLNLLSKMTGLKYDYVQQDDLPVEQKALKRFRPNMKDVLREFLDIIKSCDICQNSKITHEFIDNADASLAQMDMKPIKI